MTDPKTHPGPSGHPAARRPLAGLGMLAFLVAAALALAAPAGAQDLQQKLSETQSELQEVTEKEDVLTTEISTLSKRISTLEVEVAELRNREAVVAEKLERVKRELAEARDRLEELRARLARAIEILEQRVVEIYKSGDPDIVSVLLESNGFEEVLDRAEYLNALEDQDSSIIVRVRDLRNEAEDLVARVKEARNTIAEQKAELEKTRSELESRSGALAAARSERRSTLGRIEVHRDELEGDLTEISNQIAEQLGASSSPLPAGPIQGGSGGFIWPVNGPVTSGFGYRWGRMHEGIDIGVPGGTPIRAAKSGTIVLAAYTGGYGNYTCIDHGGGLASCYAHQSAYAITSGYVSQGTVIGYVGNTGASMGDHLHFEIRVNGAAVDPLGYL